MEFDLWLKSHLMLWAEITHQQRLSKEQYRLLLLIMTALYIL